MARPERGGKSESPRPIPPGSDRVHVCGWCRSGIGLLELRRGGAAVGGLAVGAAVGAAAVSAAQPSTTVVVQQGPAVGTIVSTLPDGCQRMTVNGTTYYQGGATCYKPSFGADGADYKVVNVP